MNEYVMQLAGRIDCLSAELKKLESRITAKPAIEVEITAYSAENLAEQIKTIYDGFANICNIKITAKIN